jgi:hypothetical protein
MTRKIPSYGEVHSCATMSWLGIILLCAFFGLVSADVRAQGTCAGQVLDYPPDSLNESFGMDIAMDGDWLVVGAPKGWMGEVESSVHLFRNVAGEWVLDSFLPTPDPSPSDWFGQSVAIDGDVIVVGDPKGDGVTAGSGVTYIYHWNAVSAQWNLVDSVTADTGTADDGFGEGVDVRGDRAVVGAPYAASEHGRAYVFERIDSTWTRTAVLSLEDGRPGDEFGRNVRLVGEDLVVSADGRNGFASRSGVVSVFTPSRDGWSLAQAFHPGGGSNSQTRFGYNLNDDGARIIITPAQVANDGTIATILVHNGNEWVVESTVTPLVFNSSSVLRGIALRGDHLVVGYSRSVDWPVYHHAFQKYTWTGSAWSYALEIVLQDFISDVEIGVGYVAVSQLICPTCFEDIPPINGQVLVFPEVPTFDCNANDIEDACEIDADPSLDCNGNDQLDECELAFSHGLDCNANDVIDSCELDAAPYLDCNGNGVLDSCEVITNPSLDCDGNGMLDACEVASDATDYNHNNRLDACEIAQGLLDDVNGDGIPDFSLAPGQLGFRLDGAQREVWCESYSQIFSEGIFSLVTQTITDQEIRLQRGDRTMIAEAETWYGSGYTRQITTFSTTQIHFLADMTHAGTYGVQQRYGDGDSRCVLSADIVAAQTGWYAVVGTIDFEQLDPLHKADYGHVTVRISDGRNVLYQQAWSSGTEEQFVHIDVDDPVLLDAMHPYVVEFEMLGFGDDYAQIAGDVDLRFEPAQVQPCPWDVAGADGMVGVDDFFALLQHWGPCPGEPDPCPWNVTGGDDMVGVDDFFALLQHWGPCP